MDDDKMTSEQVRLALIAKIKATAPNYASDYKVALETASNDSLRDHLAWAEVVTSSTLAATATPSTSDCFDADEWVADWVNRIPSILEGIRKGMKVPDGENVLDYCDRLEENLDLLQAADDKEPLLEAIRDTDMLAARLYMGITYAYTALSKGNERLALGFLISAIGVHAIAPDWRRDALASHHAAKAAHASHATHKGNKQRAREWYAEHRSMTKDAAAEKMAKDGIVAASFRTIRGYLTGQ